MADEQNVDWEKRYKDLQRFNATLQDKADKWDTFLTDPTYKPAVEMLEPLERGTWKSQTQEAQKPVADEIPAWAKPLVSHYEETRKERFTGWLSKVEKREKELAERFPELTPDYFGKDGKLNQTMKRYGMEDPDEAFRVIAPPTVLARLAESAAPDSHRPGAPLDGKTPPPTEEDRPATWEQAVARQRAKITSSS